jgi:hypothetical protein
MDCGSRGRLDARGGLRGVASQRALLSVRQPRPPSSTDRRRRRTDHARLPRRPTGQIAAPELQQPPNVRTVFAVAAKDARTLDGCIPSEQSDQVVWVTDDEGDYLNLTDRAWSKASAHNGPADPTALTCGGPGPAGTIVIDDATGQILGVYPATPDYPHPTAQPS